MEVLNRVVNLLSAIFSFESLNANARLFYSYEWNNFFNWTITYREYSDFRQQYGIIKQIKDHPPEGKLLDAHIHGYGVEHAGTFKHKTKIIAWFVSNCYSKSGREEYVKELQKYIEVSQK